MADTGNFTEEKLREHLLQAISECKEADLYEIACEVYKILIPLYEKNCEYDLLMNAHNEMHQIYGEVVECVRAASGLSFSIFDFFFFF